MNNILILYNPYYNKTVIEDHLAILKERGITAFGKIRSKLRDQEHPNEEKLDNIFEETTKESPLQLFLTDYNSMYVAQVISVTRDIKFLQTPAYYKELDVEYWFVFDDLRLLAHKDFETIRDTILANFKALNYNNHTYAIYGNPYVYPMRVTMKEEIDYFDKNDENFKYYTNIFKSDLELETKENLVHFTFGTKTFNSFTSNTQDNIISAEIEYIQNKHNPLYDYSSLVVKYSKAVELELYRFMKIIFQYLCENDSKLLKFPYTIQGREFTLSDMQQYKANYGTYKFLLRKYEIKDAINNFIADKSLRYFTLSTIPQFINIMRGIRNESVHGSTASLQECSDIRNSMLGIGQSSFLSDLITYKQILQ